MFVYWDFAVKQQFLMFHQFSYIPSPTHRASENHCDACRLDLIVFCLAILASHQVCVVCFTIHLLKWQDQHFG